jgi:hypothetical protein
MKEKQLCNTGDEFYRIYKGRVWKVKIIKVERMPLGHIIYYDSIGKTSNVTFGRTFGTKYFKNKEIAEKVLALKNQISGLKEEITEMQYEMSLLLDENESEIKEGDKKDE